MSRISEGVRAFLSSRMALRIRILLFSLYLSILSSSFGQRERVALSPPLATFGVSFFFFFFTMEEDRRRRRRKGVGRSMSIFFLFFSILPLTSGG